MIEHRRYILYYGIESWNYGFWKSIFENPPCMKPNTPKNKQYEYRIEMIGEDEIKEIYLELVGESLDLNAIEKQLAKYKIARIEDDRTITIICKYDPMINLNMFRTYCKDKGFKILKRLSIPPD
ncbi:MAG: hypothetical protein GF329_01885 [Candidatus Lokiarchaeota archaeon]|nr:hypothetical protein [Candidatus Lokiarchaeota archaeon]